MKLQTLLISTALVLLPLCINAYPTERDSGQILIIVTNHGELGESDVKTGYYLSEVAHPWHVFKEAGFRVDFASPAGGFAPMDPKSFELTDDINNTLWRDLEAVQSLIHTKALDALDLSDYAAIFFAGGHGTMWDFPDNISIQNAVAAFYQSGRPVGAVCHGPAALVNVRLPDGTHLLDGKRVNGFTNEEENKVGLTETVPFLLESKMREAGATFESSKAFQPHVTVDGVLVTAQNPASATKAAKAILKVLETSKR